MLYSGTVRAGVLACVEAVLVVVGADEAAEGACANVKADAGAGVGADGALVLPPKLKPLAAGAAVAGAAEGAGALPPKLKPPDAGAGAEGAAAVLPAVVDAPKEVAVADAPGAFVVPPKENPPLVDVPEVAVAGPGVFPPFVPPEAAGGAPNENAMVDADFCVFIIAPQMPHTDEASQFVSPNSCKRAARARRASMRTFLQFFECEPFKQNFRIQV